MSNKPARNDALTDRLSRSREIHISVTGRKSGRTISVPVWFALDNEKLYLLPARGSDTQWYKNVLRNPSIRVKSGATAAELEASPVTNTKQVSSIVERFRAKYGDSGVKLYSKLDVAVSARMK
ncbi:MAG TPA: nitroreductase/quinone reductase family protein [Candidatus Methylomirabilis sp.]|nr:nitroreductase/quinone reductase family protein [Candidatus Methylomirabilis sp.]